MKIGHLILRHDTTRAVVLALTVCLVPLLVSGCGPKEAKPEEKATGLALSSSVFKEGGTIPAKYTCDGEGVSPPLTWGEPPVGTQSFALIMEDLDAPAGVFTHWVLFNVPQDSRGLPEGVPTQAQLSSGALQGRNDFQGIGYGSPCPPVGSPHRYRFTLYALDRQLELEAEASKRQVLDAMQGHILAQAQLVGTYQR